MLKNKLSKLSFLALICLVALGGSWVLLTQEAAPGTIRVGWYEHPPLFSQDPVTGQPTGYYVTLLSQIARLQNLRIEYVKTTRSALLDGLNAGRDLDMGMPITISDARKLQVDFSWPISEYNFTIAGRAEAIGGVASLNLENKTFGVLRGAYGTEILQLWYQTGLIGVVETFETPAALSDALLAGKIDYIFDESEFMDALMLRYPDAFAPIHDPGLITPLFYKAFPVAKEKIWLLSEINRGLRQIMNDGTYSAIHREFYGGGIAQDSSSQSRASKDVSRDRLPALAIDDNYDARAIMDNYFDMISSESEGVRNQASIAVIDHMVNEGRHEFQSKLQRSVTRLKELLLLIDGQPKYAPYFADFYYRQIDDLRKSFEDIRATLENYVQKFELENVQMINNLKMIQLLDITEPELSWRKGWIEKNLNVVIASQSRWLRQIEDLLRQGNEFQAQLDDIMTKAEREFFENYQEFYSYRFNFIGNFHGQEYASYQWHELSRGLSSWIVALPTQFLVINPDPIWWPVLLRLLIFMAVGAGLSIILLARYHREIIKRYARPFISLWIGTFLLIGVTFLPSTNDNLFFSFAMLFFSLGLMDAAWKARDSASAVSEQNPFILNLLSLFIIDLVTDLLAPHRVVLATLVVLAVVNMVWLVYCFLASRHQRNRRLGSLWLLGGLIWLGAGSAAWLGYLYPAMFIAVLGVLALAVFYAGILFTHILFQVSRGINSSRHSLASFISTLVIPFLWFGLTFGAMRWSANIFNADWFFEHFYDVNLIPAVAIEISLRTILVLILSGLLIRFFLNWLGEILLVVSDARQLDAVSVNSTFLVIRYLVWILFAVLVFTTLHIDWENLKWILGGLSVGFGFALKDILENFFSGIIVLIGKQVRPGDTIEFGSVYGKVEKINIRATFIKTEDNALIAIPNSQIVSKEFRNWTLNGHIRRQEFEVGIAYGSDIQEVVETMLQVMNASNIVLKVIPPDVIFVDFGSSAILLRARFWVHVDNRTKSASVLRRDMEEAFRARGIVIPFPQLDIHLEASNAGALISPANSAVTQPASGAAGSCQTRSPSGLGSGLGSESLHW